MRRYLLLPLAVILLLTADQALACNVPVFRYALERWPADSFEVFVFHRGPLAPADKALCDTLAKYAETAPAVANYTFDRIDLDRKPDKEMAQLFDAQKVKGLPLLVVRYPGITGIKENAWAGRLSLEAVKSLLDSPARRAVVRRIVSGDSAVWLLLESGNRDRDEAAAKLLQGELAKLQKTLKLPELTADPEDKLSAKGPALQLAFSMVRVSRTDPAEKMLVEMLLHLEPDLRAPKYASEPMAFAVFGRGRALPPLIGKGITPENLSGDARFLIGPCTCKVKEQNPGVDLLVVADWEAPAARQPVLTFPTGQSSSTVAPPTAAAPPSEGSVLLLRNLLLAAGSGVVLVGALTFLVMRKGAGPSRKDLPV